MTARVWSQPQTLRSHPWFQGPFFALGVKRPFAGIWKNCSPTCWPSVTKTKAHRTKKEAIAVDKLHEWFGNDLADRMAKESARNALPSATYTDAFDSVVKKGASVARSIAKLLSLWPSFSTCIKQDVWVKPTQTAEAEKGYPAPMAVVSAQAALGVQEMPANTPQ